MKGDVGAGNIKDQSYYRPPQRLSLKRKLKDRVASFVSFEPVIRRLGFVVIEKFPPTTCMVYKVAGAGGRVLILKAARRITASAYRQVEREKELLTLLSGMDGVPEIVAGWDDVKAPLFSCISNFLRELKVERDRLALLTRGFVNGRERRPGEILTALQSERLKRIIDACHRSDYAGLGIDNPRNVLVDDRQNLYFIDFGTVYRKGEVSEEEYELLTARDYDRLYRIALPAASL
jgi:predicted Ser/Thr protein kinase